MAKTVKKKPAKKAAKKILKSKKVLVKTKNKVAKKAAKKFVKKPKNFVSESWDSVVWDDLKKRGVDRAVLKFEGGGDDGCIFECNLYSGSKKTKVECLFGNTEEEKKLVEALGGPIWDRYCGFNWFDHCDGTLTWNVKTNQIEWSGNHEPEGLDIY